MPRGQQSPVGTVTVNANGYSQTKTEAGWVGTHTLVLEKKLGRKLAPGERAVFKDGDRGNLDPSNIELKQSTNAKSLRAKIAKWTAEIEDRQEWIALAKAQLESPTASTSSEPS